MSIVSNSGLRTPISTTAPSQKKAGDTSELLSQAGGHAHTSSTSSISGLSPSENVKATGGELGITGKFHAKELVSDEVREKILKGEARSKGPMPGLMESIFQPTPAKVTAQPQRNSFARAWDSIAGGVKKFFKALGQRFGQPAATPVPMAPQAPMPDFNMQSVLRMKIIRSNEAMWGKVVEAVVRGQTTDQLAVFTATEKFLESSQQSRNEFMTMSGVVLRPIPDDPDSQANIEWTLRDEVIKMREADTYDSTAAAELTKRVHGEIAGMFRVDYVNKIPFAKEELFAQGKKTGLITS